MKKLLLSAGLILTLTANAQTGVSGGITMIKGFGVPNLYPGIHLGIEIPRDDEVSFYGRITTTMSNRSDKKYSVNVEAREATTFPNVMSVDYTTKFNYINFEGGTRYYIGNGYDYGWSAYGGSLFMLSVNSIKADIASYDESKYQLPSDFTRKGSIVALNLGLNAGIKNHFMFGMVYFDMTFAYSLFAIPSNTMASSVGGNMFSPLTFAFNLGYRKDIF